jgi:hypothetical protein
MNESISSTLKSKPVMNYFLSLISSVFYQQNCSMAGSKEIQWAILQSSEIPGVIGAVRLLRFIWQVWLDQDLSPNNTYRGLTDI